MLTFDNNTSHKRNIARLWPYALFSIIVILYNYFNLDYGFNATDEGYLLSLGSRIVDGQAPYKDFFFLRTPLSIYHQAVWQYLLGDSYTVIVSRIFCMIQMWLVAVLTSLLYYRFVSRLETFLLLSVSYFISTMFISFPWYNFDAALFIVLAAVFLSKRYYLISGVAIFLAFMAKQNYLLLLPILGLAAIVVKRLKIKSVSISGKIFIKLSAGFLLPAVVYVGYHLSAGSLDEFVSNIIILPRQCSGSSLLYLIFQDNLTALPVSIPLVGFVTVLFAPTKWKRPVAVLLLSAALFLMIYSSRYLIYSLVYFNYTVFIVAILIFRKKLAESESVIISSLPFIMLLALLAQYISGISYSGVITAYTGVALALPVGYVLLKVTVSLKIPRILPVIFLLLILIISSYHKHNFIYRDDDRENLTAEFADGKLKGIKSTPRNVNQINGLASAVENFCGRDDYILVYPDFPILYYLTGRKNPGPVDWFYQHEFNLAMVEKTIEKLEQNRPKVVFVQKYNEADYLREGAFYPYKDSQIRYSHLYKYITFKYEPFMPVGDLFLFVPKDSS